MARISRPRPKLGGQGAKLYFTDFNVSTSVAEMRAFGEAWSTHVPVLSKITFSGVMTNTEGSYALMMRLLDGGGIDFLQERREWLCTWCGSPNPIEHRHCSQCGGPRGWIL